jgi:hypothetical protein
VRSALRFAQRKEALEFASALSCLKHSTAGDFSRTTLEEEVEALLRGEASGRGCSGRRDRRFRLSSPSFGDFTTSVFGRHNLNIIERGSLASIGRALNADTVPGAQSNAGYRVPGRT